MTTVELATSLAILGVLAGITIRAADSAADRARVTLVQGSIVNAYREAQQAARSLGTPVSVVVSADSVVVRTADSVVLRWVPGPRLAGVGLTPAAHETVFEASGAARGTGNVGYRLWLGRVVRQVVVSRLGRLRTG